MGGYHIPGLDGVEGTPSQVWMVGGVPHPRSGWWGRGYPIPGLDGGLPWYPQPGLNGGGYLGYPQLGLDGVPPTL